MTEFKPVLRQVPSFSDADLEVFGHAFLASPNASFVVEWNGDIAFANRRAERLFGVNASQEERGNLPLHALTQHVDEDVKRLLKTGAASGSVSLAMKNSAGDPLPKDTVFRVSLLPSSTRGERLYLLTQDQIKSTADALAKMNTRRKEARDNLLRLETAHLELHQSLVSMEAFSRAASHDLRTPINTLLGMLELFEDKFGGALPEKGHEYLSVMSRAVGQMSKLTDDLLDHAKSTRPGISAEPIELAPIVTQVQADLDIAVKGASARIDVSGEGFAVMAEPLLLHVLISNILANALKYSAPDRILRVDVVMDPNAGKNGEIRIRDNGIGFEPDQAKLIFKPFQRLQNTIPGTGIGLSTCAEVCNRHGWDISATGQTGVGAEFVVTF